MTMPAIRVLAFSSSRVQNSAYLERAVPVIKNFLGNKPLNIAFIPFADAENKYEDYLEKTKDGLAELPYNIHLVTPDNAAVAIKNANVIMVGGGNTFKLQHHLYQYELVDLIREQVTHGIPYVGWSAGANITGLTIGTTNDMPIIEPKSFKALGFFPFQINPHYIDVKPEGHHGETRDQRLTEYLRLNPEASIIGLPEGTALQLEGKSLTLVGNVPAILFRIDSNQADPVRTIIHAGADISWLL
jgi:dipeptidase E